MVEFNGQGIETYVPIQKKTRQYASRVKNSEVALIPSHIFVRINRAEYLQILRHTQIFQFLNFSGILMSIPDNEMQMMRRVVGEVEDVIIHDLAYSIGDEVQIIGGELTGLKGKLIGEGKHNVLIELSTIGMGLQINIDSKYLMQSSKKLAVA